MVHTHWVWLDANTCLYKQWLRKLCTGGTSVSCDMFPFGPFPPVWLCHLSGLIFLNVSFSLLWKPYIYACTGLETSFKSFRNIPNSYLYYNKKKIAKSPPRDDQHLRLQIFGLEGVEHSEMTERRYPCEYTRELQPFWKASSIT